MDAGLERLADAALVRITSGEGGTLGTGFVVGPGQVLTCHHVVAPSAAVVVHFADGERAAVDAAALTLLPEVDLAVVPVPPAAGRACLPLAPAGPRPATFWTKGFQLQDRGFAGAVPTGGGISGHSEVAYAHGDFAYRLPALVLGGGDLNPGLSGAPLFDPASGAVYAVVIAHLSSTGQISGCAVALGEAAGRAPALEPLLRGNDLTVARFGRRVNALGAHDLCARQVRAALERLEQERLYLPRYLCARGAPAACADAFAAGTLPFLAVHGPAGAGKTSWLASLAASRAERQPLLFLRGQAIAPGSTGLEALADAALMGLDVEAWREAPRAGDVTDALRAAGGGLWILLDAINESRLALRELADLWLPATVAWVTGSGARLVVTCRSEDWHLLATAFPRGAVQPPPDGSADRAALPGLALGAFSDEEEAAARALYGLAAPASADFLRHPLAMRLRWELERDGGERGRGRLGLGTIIDRFVERNCERAAVRLGTRPQQVRATVNRLAGLLLETRAPEVDFATADARFAPTRAHLDALASEHLLVATETGFAFSFDDVGEYLQSAHVADATLAEASSLWEAGPRALPVPAGVLAHAVGRLAARSDAASLEGAVRGLCRAASAGRHHHLAFDVAARIAGTDRGAPFAERIVAAVASFNARRAWSLFVQQCDRLPLPADATLRLVRLLLPEEDWYGWRSKDWQDAGRRKGGDRVLESGMSLSRAVAQALAQDAPRAVQILWGWIDDRARLLEAEGHSEASVGDFALAVLFYGRRLALAPLLAHLDGGAWNRGARDLLSTLAETDWEAVGPFVERWIGRPGGDAKAYAVAAHLYRLTGGGWREIAVRLFNRLVGEAGDAVLRLESAGQLAELPAERERVWPLLRDGFQQGAPSVSPYTLGYFLDTHGTDVFALFESRLAGAAQGGWSDIGAATRIFSALGAHATTPSDVAVTVRLLERDWPAKLAYHVASTLESILYRVGPEAVANTGIVGLAARLIADAPESGDLKPLLFIAYPSPPDEYAGTAPLRALFEASDDVEIVGQICRLAAALARDHPEVYGWLDPFGRRVARDLLDGKILRALGEAMSDEFGLLVEADWRARPADATSPLATAYLAARDAGLRPTEASWRALSAD